MIQVCLGEVGEKDNDTDARQAMTSLLCVPTCLEKLRQFVLVQYNIFAGQIEARGKCVRHCFILELFFGGPRKISRSLETALRYSRSVAICPTHSSHSIDPLPRARNSIQHSWQASPRCHGVSLEFAPHAAQRSACVGLPLLLGEAASFRTLACFM